MCLMRNAKRQGRAERRSQHDDTVFDREGDAKNVGVLVKAVYGPIDGVLARVHGGGVTKRAVARGVLAEHAARINEGAKGACIKVVYPSRVIEQP